MTLWFLFGLMTAAALFAVLWPLARRPSAARGGSDLLVYKDQLQEIDRDRAAGLIGETEAEAARLEISRRLLAAADAKPAGESEAPVASAAPLLRRSAGHAKSEFTCGPVRLDTRTGRVSVDGNPVKLTSHEYRLLSYLMHHTGRVVSRTELVEHLYDQDFDRDSNTIEVFVGRIRKKLGVDVIQTVRGLGYLLTPPDAR